MRAKAGFVGIAVVALATALLPLLKLPARKPLSKPGDEPAHLREIRARGAELFRRGDYASAEACFREGLDAARAARHEPSAARFLVNLGSAYYGQFQFDRALDLYLEAEEAAERLNDNEVTVKLAVNLASLYSQLGDPVSAIAAAERGLRLAGSGYRRTRGQLLVLVGRIHAQEGRTEAALGSLRQGIELATAEDDLTILPNAWNYLGDQLVKLGRFDEAERSFQTAQALRDRAGLKDPTPRWFYSARLEMARGNATAAVELLGRAEAAARRSGNLAALTHIYLLRGRALSAARREREALASLRRALECLRRFRLHLPFADQVLVGTENDVGEVYREFIGLGNTIAVRSGSTTLIRETFEAAEENRAYSLRKLLSATREVQSALPPDYWRTLAEVRSAETKLLAKDSPELRVRLRDLQARLTSLEAKAGFETRGRTAPDPTGSDEGPLLARLAHGLDAGQAYLSFYLGSKQSYLWTVTREGLDLTTLPPGHVIAPLARRFAAAVRSGNGSASQLGVELRAQLLGQAPGHTGSKRVWLLGLDDVLFEVPFAALPGPDGAHSFLVESHALGIVPGAWLLAAPKPGAAAVSFLGVGDAIYNSADSRWRRQGGPQPPAQQAGWFSILRAAHRSPTWEDRMELTRLAGSAREVEACASFWRSRAAPVRLLTGAAASPSLVQAELRRGPAIVHFAAHFVPSRQNAAHALLALSQASEGQVQFVSPDEISRARWGQGVSLVVLSGCASGAAIALPSTGLLGMTRAWLASGTEAVAASHWPTPDDSGEFYVAFYRHLADSSRNYGTARAAISLQNAQISMLRSGTWRANPKYWGAFFVAGKG